MKIRSFHVTALLAAASPARDSGTGFRHWTISFSPLHFALPVLELTAEYLAMPKLGVAAVGGIGMAKQKETDISGQTTEYKYRVYEAGAQFRFYPLKAVRHAPLLGGEMMWLHVSSAGGGGSGNIQAAAAGVSSGPFLGYKFTAQAGFTFDMQVGYQFMLVRAEAGSSSGATASGEKTGDGVLLNLNLGWTF